MPIASPPTALAAPGLWAVSKQGGQLPFNQPATAATCTISWRRPLSARRRSSWASAAAAAALARASWACGGGTQRGPAAGRVSRRRWQAAHSRLSGPHARPRRRAHLYVAQHAVERRLHAAQRAARGPYAVAAGRQPRAALQLGGLAQHLGQAPDALELALQLGHPGGVAVPATTVCLQHCRAPAGLQCLSTEHTPLRTPAASLTAHLPPAASSCDLAPARRASPSENSHSARARAAPATSTAAAAASASAAARARASDSSCAVRPRAASAAARAAAAAAASASRQDARAASWALADASASSSPRCAAARSAWRRAAGGGRRRCTSDGELR